MLKWVLTFLIVALVALVFASTGIAGRATNIVWTLFTACVILAVLFALAGRSSGS